MIVLNLCTMRSPAIGMGGAFGCNPLQIGSFVRERAKETYGDRGVELLEAAKGAQGLRPCTQSRGARRESFSFSEAQMSGRCPDFDYEGLQSWISNREDKLRIGVIQNLSDPIRQMLSSPESIRVGIALQKKVELLANCIGQPSEFEAAQSLLGSNRRFLYGLDPEGCDGVKMISGQFGTILAEAQLPQKIAEGVTESVRSTLRAQSYQATLIVESHLSERERAILRAAKTMQERTRAEMKILETYQPRESSRIAEEVEFRINSLLKEAMGRGWAAEVEIRNYNSSDSEFLATGTVIVYLHSNDGTRHQMEFPVTDPKVRRAIRELNEKYGGR